MNLQEKMAAKKAAEEAAALALASKPSVDEIKPDPSEPAIDPTAEVKLPEVADNADLGAGPDDERGEAVLEILPSDVDLTYAFRPLKLNQIMCADGSVFKPDTVTGFFIPQTQEQYELLLHFETTKWNSVERVIPQSNAVE